MNRETQFRVRVRMAPLLVSLIAGVLPLAGCGAAASFLLKPPIVDRCHDTNLQGCDDLADGVIAYATGDKDAAKEKVMKAAAQNAPADLKDFAAKLRLLKSVPGIEKYSGPLLEVADMLAPDAAPMSVRASTHVVAAAIAAPPSKAQDDSAARSASPRGAARGALSDTVVPAADGAEPCALLKDATFSLEPGSPICVDLAKGPIVVTDVRTVGVCPNALVLGAGEPSSPRWLLYGEPSSVLGVHGAAYDVPAGERLFAAQSGPKGRLVTDVRCAITWSGHTP